jgi:flagellar basal-body rod protein FlgB
LTTATLAKCLDGVGLRHRAIADNIANVETPGFTRSEVSFEDKLKQAFESKGEGSLLEWIEETSAEVRLDASSPARPDGNNVSIDKEMAELTKNTLQYEALIQLLNLKASMVRAAITEGKR